MTKEEINAVWDAENEADAEKLKFVANCGGGTYVNARRLTLRAIFAKIDKLTSEVYALRELIDYETLTERRIP